MDKRLIDAKWREVPFEIMLKCDEEIKCECWLLSNSINKYGVDLRQPMMFNNFLRLIGTHLTSMNCKSLFGQAKWYVIDDGVQPDFFLNKHPLPTIKPGDKVRHEMHGYGTAHVTFKDSKNVLVAFNKCQHAVIVSAEELEVVE